MEQDTSESIIATRLDRCIHDTTHLEKIRDAVKRTHKIVTDGTELIALHLTRCLQAGTRPPHVDAAWVKSCLLYTSPSPRDS